MTSSDVKAWLSRIGKDRAWLAMQCRVKKGTVDNWLSRGRPIPAKSQVIIATLMSGDPSAAVPQNLVLDFSPEQFDALEDAARREDKKIRRWAIDTLNTAAELDVKELAAKILTYEPEAIQADRVADEGNEEE